MFHLSNRVKGYGEHASRGDICQSRIIFEYGDSHIFKIVLRYS